MASGGDVVVVGGVDGTGSGGSGGGGGRGGGQPSHPQSRSSLSASSFVVSNDFDCDTVRISRGQGGSEGIAEDFVEDVGSGADVLEDPFSPGLFGQGVWYDRSTSRRRF